MSRRYRPFHLLLTLFVAQVTLAAETSHIPDILGQDISRFKELMSSPVAEQRIEGAQGARHLRLATFEPELIGLLKDHDPVVRQEAVIALSQCGTSDSVGHLHCSAVRRPMAGPRTRPDVALPNDRAIFQCGTESRMGTVVEGNEH